MVGLRVEFWSGLNKALQALLVFATVKQCNIGAFIIRIGF